MNSGSIVAAVALGLSALVSTLPAQAAGSGDGDSSHARQTRGQQRTAAPGSARQGRQQPANGSQANVGATSTATSASEGGIGVGSQGQSLTVDNHARAAASTAIAPPLTSSNDTCMGSASIGATGMAFGLSLGTTYTDENCMMLKNSRELWNMGFRGAAIARMCMDQRNRQALEASGVTCPATAAATTSTSPTATTAASANERATNERVINEPPTHERVVKERPANERVASSEPVATSERPAKERSERREKSIRDVISPSAQSERFGRW